MIVRAYKHSSTHNSNLPIFSAYNTIIKVFERTYARQHNHLCLQDYRHFRIIVCVLVCGYQTCEYRRMWACNHQSICIQSYENDDIQVNGMWSSKHIDIGAYDHRNMWTSKYVSIGACDHLSRLVSILSSKQSWMWVDYQQSMWSWKHPCICAFKHPSMHTFNLQIILAFKHNHEHI